ncbi:MAG: hypothetical protein Q4P33_05900 [Flaviflexus sp.]|nr:hypothetical protein [Flaviflexus sp.]
MKHTTSKAPEAADLSRAPLPTEATLKRRRSVPYQAMRFASFNLRMMRIVLKGH